VVYELTVSVVVTQTGGRLVVALVGGTMIGVLDTVGEVIGLVKVQGQSVMVTVEAVRIEARGKIMGEHLLVSLAVAVYVLVPWVKVVDSGQKVV